MMLTISIQKPGLLKFSHVRTRHLQKLGRINSISSVKMELKSSQNKKMEDLSVELPPLPDPQIDSSRERSLQFNRVQPDHDLFQGNKFEFGRFIAREAMLDEEYWTAAWLRAESLCEDRKNDRYVDSYKRKLVEQEFSRIKRPRLDQNAEKCTCIVTVKKDTKNVKHTVLKSIVGTLDLKIQYLYDGETFPRELKAPKFGSFKRTRASRYGYIANLCVAKIARRQGIARNMLQFAVNSAVLDDVEQVYVHVDRNNIPAQKLYENMGFQMIERATPKLEEDQTYLLGLKI